LSRIDVWLEKRRGTKIKGICWLRSGSLGACGVQGNILFGSSFSLSGPFIGNPASFGIFIPHYFPQLPGISPFAGFAKRSRAPSMRGIGVFKNKFKK
jgi:hypothetical protein